MITCNKRFSRSMGMHGRLAQASETCRDGLRGFRSRPVVSPSSYSPTLSHTFRNDRFALTSSLSSAAVRDLADRWHLQRSKSHSQVSAIPSSVVLLQKRRSNDPDASSIIVYLSITAVSDYSLTDAIFSRIRSKVEGLARQGDVGLSCPVVAEKERDIWSDGLHY